MSLANRDSAKLKINPDLSDFKKDEQHSVAEKTPDAKEASLVLSPDTPLLHAGKDCDPAHWNKLQGTIFINCALEYKDHLSCTTTLKIVDTAHQNQTQSLAAPNQHLLHFTPISTHHFCAFSENTFFMWDLNNLDQKPEVFHPRQNKDMKYSRFFHSFYQNRCAVGVSVSSGQPVEKVDKLATIWLFDFETKQFHYIPCPDAGNLSVLDENHIAVTSRQKKLFIFEINLAQENIATLKTKFDFNHFKIMPSPCKRYWGAIATNDEITVYEVGSNYQLSPIAHLFGHRIVGWLDGKFLFQQKKNTLLSELHSFDPVALQTHRLQEMEANEVAQVSENQIVRFTRSHIVRYALLTELAVQNELLTVMPRTLARLTTSYVGFFETNEAKRANTALTRPLQIAANNNFRFLEDWMNYCHRHIFSGQNKTYFMKLLTMIRFLFNELATLEKPSKNAVTLCLNQLEEQSEFAELFKDKSAKVCFEEIKNQLLAHFDEASRLRLK